LAPGQTSDLHARLGLLALAPTFAADPGVLRAALDRAGGLEMRALRARVAPVQALAWRALGPLAEAGRARPLPATAWDAASCRILARALALQVAAALRIGDAPRASALLEAWRPALKHEPDWAVARAHAWALEGFDPEACAELEAALAAHPGAAECAAELARARTRRGDLRGAAAAWAAVAQMLPGAAQPWCELANLELLGGRLEPALQRLAEAQRREPGHRASREAVRACLESDPAAEARFWAVLCEQRRDVGSWWRLRGSASLRAGAWDEASAALEHAAALAAGDRDGWDTLAADLEHCDAEPARRIFARLQALAGRT
jgi:tetratricopeptide (TPR) repeat protein